MGTILTYRNDGERPFCEIALDDGDHVQVQLDRRGFVIERPALEHRAAEVLFKGDVELVSDLCAAMLGPGALSKTTPLDVLVSIVKQMPTAVDVRAAFGAAAKSI